eukprot:1331080-Rhodomonas_salina.3
MLRSSPPRGPTHYRRAVCGTSVGYAATAYSGVCGTDRFCTALPEAYDGSASVVASVANRNVWPCRTGSRSTVAPPPPSPDRPTRCPVADTGGAVLRKGMESDAGWCWYKDWY